MTAVSGNSSSKAAGGIIFDIARFCLDDGPGIRTVIFLKGCPLHCAWCHNPEGLSAELELSCTEALCLACGRCVAVCPAGCHQLTKGCHSFDFSSCQQCGQCVTACPAGALAFIGRQASVRELLAEALRDVPYYRSSGGGVTLSGGEAAAQPRFAAALLTALKEHGIHTCLESSGLGSTKERRLLYSLADLVLLDFKHSDPIALKSWTGLDMAQFTKSLDLLQEMNRPVFLRCPLLEGVNATMSHIQAIAELALRYSSIQQIDLLPYHELGCDKAKSLGLSQQQFTRPEQKTLEEFQQYLQEKSKKPVRL